MKLSDSEKRDIINLIQKDSNLPEKYRFLLFNKADQVELNWFGKSRDFTNVVLPFQIIEQVDEPRNENHQFEQRSLIDFQSGRQLKGWTNKLIWGDNKYVLSSLKNGPLRHEIEKEGGIKLIYIDPPFDVGADFSMSLDIGDDSYEKKPNVLEQIAYRDTWGLGSDSFLQMIYERLVLMKDLLSEDGTIFVHCDWRLSAKIKLVLEEVFGIRNELNEIIWCFSQGAKSKRMFARKHNTIFSFAKNIDQNFFNADAVKVEMKSGKSSFGGRLETDEDGRKYRLVYGTKNKQGETRYYKYYLDEGKIPEDYWTDINSIQSGNNERTGYPTQKPESLLKRIILSATKENDIVCDFFSGSGTTASVSEKLGRKWICSDLGKFAIHTTRKRLINVQRELKASNKQWRAFEILNLGKYQRDYYIYDGSRDNRDINKKKESDFENLVFQAYKSFKINGFKTLHAKKGDVFVSLGPINQPLSRNHVEEVIEECLKNNITSVDILGFEYEMGLFPTIQEEAKNKGLRLIYKQIPMDIFDKRAVSNNEVVFHDVAYIDYKVIKNKNKLIVELTDFAVFYSEDNLNLNEQLQKNKSKIVVENGNILEKTKDEEGNISQKLLTESWKDWIDYWSVDFNYESKKEVIKVFEDNEIKEYWTGNYVFENEWQSFRNIKNKEIEIRTSEKLITQNNTKVAVKVVDIFGNDTMKLLDVSM